MEPNLDSIVIKIQKNRKEPQKKIWVKTNDNLDEIKKLISDAYNSIR
jgi:hypothetical protein